jgi:hypothetical protein
MHALQSSSHDPKPQQKLTFPLFRFSSVLQHCLGPGF